jgi:hypothetical protein
MMNTLLISAAISWCAAQTAKIFFGLIRYGINDKPRILWRVIWAGGMPSAHSALVSSATLVIFFSAGPQSLLFGLSLLFSFIVIYDRSRMHAIYRQFQKKFPSLETNARTDPVFRDLVGHRISEILAGVAIGLGTGFLAMLL